MSVPSSPEERRAEFFAGNPQGENPPSVPMPSCPVCGLTLSFVTRFMEWECNPCCLTWRWDGTNGFLSLSYRRSENHPLWSPSVVDVDTGGKT